MKNTISTGMIVIDRTDAEAMANVLVIASGLNSRPLSPVRTKMGRKLTVTISRPKNRLGPTSTAAPTITRLRGRGDPPAATRSSSRSRCLWAFSTMTMALSTTTPTAMAIPPRLMMLVLMPSRCMASRLHRTLVGTTKMATNSLRAWSRNRMHTRPTTTISSTSVCRRVWTDRPIRSDRSYAVLIDTPGGSPCSSSASFALASCMTW